MPIKRLNIPIRLNDLFKVIRFFNSREEELHVSYRDLKDQLQTDLSVTAGSSTLDGLTDVTISSVANGQVLVYDSATSQWINQTAGPATTLNGLTDVTISSVANGQFLVYNSGTSQWENVTVSIPSTINSLTDVNTPSPVNGNVLTWDSATSQWIALAPVYSSTFAGLSDVNVVGVANDNTIRYDAASGKWVPTNITPATSLNGLTGVTLSSPTNGQLLIYNSTTSQWENQPAPSGTGTVTSVSTGTGLTGGPITSSGTISLNSKLAPADSLVGNSLKYLRVNAGETAVEYATVAGGGITSGNAQQVSAGVYTTTISGVTSYTAGDTYIIKFDSENDGDSTLNISSVGAIPILKNTNVKLSSGDIKANQEITIVYDGANFQAIGLVSTQILAYVHNAEGAVISKGQVVYAYQATGNKMSVKLARADSDATSAKTIGMVYDSSIGINSDGYIIIQGVIESINTAAYSAGDTLYLSGTTFGDVTNVKPYAPIHLVYVGIVERSNAGNGQIYVRCQNGYELDEIHDVDLISTPPTNNQVLAYDSATTLWKNKSLGTILGGTTSQYVRGDGSLATFPSVAAPATIYYGDGFDGAIILNGTNTYASIMTLVGSTYTLSRSIFPSSLTVNAGITLLTNGYQITCNGTTTIDGTVGSVGNNGGNAVALIGTYSTAGAGATSLKNNSTVNDQILVPSAISGGNGNNGSGGWGAAGVSINVTWYYYGSLGGGGGRGWINATTQGPASTVTVSTGKFLPYPTFSMGLSNHIGWLTVNVINFGGVFISAPGAGGGAGVNLGGSWGGAGGGGGGNPYGVKILSNLLSIGATGIIRSNAGNGGNGCAGNGANWAHGAGGGGAAGGIVYLVTNSLTYTPANNIQAKGGIGGTGGFGAGTGAALYSTNGSNGADGYIIIVNTTSGISTFYTGQY